MSFLARFKLVHVLWVCCISISLFLFALATPLIQSLFHQVITAQVLSESNVGVNLVRPLTKNLAVHRGLTNRIRNGDKTATDKREKAAGIIGNSFNQLKHHYGDNQETQAWLKTIQNDWSNLLGDVDSPTLDSRDIFGRHSMLISRILIYTARKTASSNESKRQSLIGIRNDFLSMADLVGQIRGMGAGYIASKGADKSVPGDIRVLSELLSSRMLSSRTSATDLHHHDAHGVANSIENTDKSITKYMTLVNDVISNTSNHNAGKFFEAGTAVIGEIGGTLDIASSTLDTNFANSISTSSRKGWITGGIVMALILIIIAAFSLVVTHINRQLRRVEADISRAASGKLAIEEKPNGNDEFSKLRTHFGESMQAMSGLVKGIRGAESSLGTYLKFFIGNVELCESDVTRQSTDLNLIADNSVDLGMDCSKLYEEAISLKSSFKETSDSSLTAKNATSQSIQYIENLHHSIIKAVEDMSVLIDRSKEIDDVVEVIQSIAEQTNLLALNAAIEAARAGEQGRGFAVVADEVRTLASRTQSSTGEIQSIVNNLQKGFNDMSEAVSKNADAVAGAVEQAQVAGTSCDDIVEQIERLSSVAINIANVSEKQNNEAAHISESIRNLNNSRDIIHNTLEETRKNSQDVIVTLSQLKSATAQFSLDDTQVVAEKQ